MRLFAALPLPPFAVERLTRLRLRLASPGDGLRWSPPEQWHLTLQFYGEVDPDCVACLHAALQIASLPAPDLALDSLDLFPAKGILYAAADLTPSLAALHRSVVHAGITCGIVPDPKPFRPHITLARSKGRTGSQTLRALCTPTLPAFGPSIHWRAGECLLLQSTLTPQGAQYTTEARIPLAHS